MLRETKILATGIAVAIGAACSGAKADQPLVASTASGTVASSQASAVVAPSGTSLVRLVNALPDEAAIDLRGGVHTFFADQEYQTASSYVEVEDEITSFELLRHVSGSKLSSQHLTLADGERYTIIAMPEPDGGVRLRVFRDDLKPEPGVARLRVINAAPHVTHTDVSIQGRKTPLFEDVSYGATPRWQNITPTTATVEIWHDVNGSLPVVIKDMQFSAGKSYTIVLAGAPGTPMQAIAFSDVVIDRAVVRTAQAQP